SWWHDDDGGAGRAARPRAERDNREGRRRDRDDARAPGQTGGGKPPACGGALGAGGGGRGGHGGHYDNGVESKQAKGGPPQGKQANVKRLMKRLLMAATEETGPRRIVGFFAVTFTAGGNVGLAYALTADEHEIA